MRAAKLLAAGEISDRRKITNLDWQEQSAHNLLTRYAHRMPSVGIDANGKVSLIVGAKVGGLISIQKRKRNSKARLG